MPLIDLPPQVTAECDGCRAVLEYDGIILHFERVGIAGELADHDWTVVDDRVLCADCPSPTDTTEENDVPTT